MKKLKTYNCAAIISFTVMSLSVLLTPFSPAYDPLNGKPLFTYLIFALFWAGFIAGIISTYLASNTRKKLKPKLKKKNKMPGIQNTESTVAMAVFLIGLISTAVFRLLHVTSLVPLQFLCLFCIFWGLSMHSIFDGINYRTAKRFNRVQIKEETK